MADMTIPDDLHERLQAIAEQEKVTTVDVLRNLVEQYTPPSPEVPQPGTLAGLAAALEGVIPASEVTDTSERSREILEEEFAEYIRRNQDEA